MKRYCGIGLGLVCCVMVGLCVPASAGTLTFVSNDGWILGGPALAGLKAEVVFENLEGNVLKVTLTNLASVVNVNGQVLTGLFFKTADNNLTVIPTGATAQSLLAKVVIGYDNKGKPIYGWAGVPNSSGASVAEHWAFKAGTEMPPLPIVYDPYSPGYNYGLGACGFGPEPSIFGAKDLICGYPVQGEPDGIGWGIVNGEVDKSVNTPDKLVSQSATFFLNNWNLGVPLCPEEFDTSGVGNIYSVVFQYGSSSDDTAIYVGATTIGAVEAPSVVPEPLTMGSAFFAIGGLGAYIRRRRGSAARQ